MKILKIAGIILIIILVLAVMLITASLINHKLQLRKEARENLPKGSLVKVNDKNMHVYAEVTG